MRIGIIGGGITGLTTAYRLSQKGYQVTIFEKESYLGGLAAGFKQKGWRWNLENFFHHLFVSDKAAKGLINELGLSRQLIYLHPKTSIFYQGKISQFDSPLNLLTFPHLNLMKKIRAGAVTAYLKLTNNWQKFEKITAKNWLKKYYGKKAFEIIWQPLLEGKFSNQASKISAVWFWARIKKRSTKLGYLKGGFQVLIDALAQKIKKNGGQIVLNQEVKSLKKLSQKFDKIIITTPTEKFFKSNLPPMLGAVNLILVLKNQFLTDGTYWLNINEPEFPFVAIVEHTNFVDKKYYAGNHILYVGGYYPQNHRYFKMTAKQIFAEFLPYLQKINPNFNFRLFTIHYSLFTNLYAQPIIPLNYSKTLSRLKKSLPQNIYLANMQTIYPWDRGVNYAIQQGKEIAQKIMENN